MSNNEAIASTVKKFRPGTHPNSLAAIKKHQWKPGQNGNPKPGNSLKAALLNALGEPLKEPGANATARERIIYATLKGAIDCEPTSAHLKEVWERVEGKIPSDILPPQNVNVVFVIGKGYKDAPQIIEGEAKELPQYVVEGGD